MRKIQMVDLVQQYQDIKPEIQSSFSRILESAAFINGPEVKGFQADLEAYLGVKHVIPCANGTDALQIAMMGLGLKPGDEVITADFTFAATVEVIALLQLVPVLVDVDPDAERPVRSERLLFCGVTRVTARLELVVRSGNTENERLINI